MAGLRMIVRRIPSRVVQEGGGRFSLSAFGGENGRCGEMTEYQFSKTILSQGEVIR
jgi:hypothetical protein